ncbi:MAG TPA: hypothetical protein DIC64_02395 [Alphaproteobacteria bacterium]|nr:hypothetical protein [Alphaproteobacteria bacterium]
MKRSFFYICLALIGFSLFFSFSAHAEKLMSDGKILCGYQNGQKGGEKVECSITKQKCISCTEFKDSGWNYVGAVLTLGMRQTKVEVYKCVDMNAPIGDCELAMGGGLKGDQYTNHIYGLFTSGKVYGDSCIVYNYFIKYANCYGCTVVQTLTSAFVMAASKAYNVSKQAGNAILLVGMMIWLAFFALKNVSSFATIEPMQMLQQFLVQCFKVVLAMVILNSGLETILHYTLVPIMKTGMDISNTISANVKDIVSASGEELKIQDFVPEGVKME